MLEGMKTIGWWTLALMLIFAIWGFAASAFAATGVAGGLIVSVFALGISIGIVGYLLDDL